MARSSPLRPATLALTLLAAWPSAASAQCTNWSDPASLGYAGDATFHAPQAETGELYVGTRCWCGYHGERLPHIARWNGAGWTQLGPPTFFDFGGDMYGLAVVDLGAGVAPHIWGTMRTHAFPAAGNFMRWTGSTWISAEEAPPGVCHAMLTYDDSIDARPHAATSSGVYRRDGQASTLLGGPSVPMNRASTMVAHDDGQGSALHVASHP